jgi:hypothetical protein
MTERPFLKIVPAKDRGQYNAVCISHEGNRRRPPGRATAGEIDVFGHLTP